MKRVLSSIIIILIFAAVAWWAVHIFYNKEPVKHQPQTKAQVTLSAVTKHLIPEVVTAYATTVSPRSVMLRAQTDGTIATLDFKAGQQVKRGQVIATLVTSSIADQSKRLRAQMITSKSNYDRLYRMNKQLAGSVSAFDLQKSKLQYQQDLASYLESRVVERITSPIDGTISDTNLAVGSFVSAGTEIADIADRHSLQLRYQLPSRFAPQVRLGQQVDFYGTDATKPLTAHVSYIAPLMDPSTYNLTIRADLNQPQQLPEHLFGRVVQTIDPQRQVLAVSQRYVQTDSSGFYVYTVQSSKVAKVYFEAGQVTTQGMIVIRSGIRAGTQIITSNITNLSAGQSVQVVSS